MKRLIIVILTTLFCVAFVSAQEQIDVGVKQRLS